MVDRTNEARNRELVQQYLNILDDSVGVNNVTPVNKAVMLSDLICFKAEGKIYVQKVEDMISTGTQRLIVNLNDVRKKSAERAIGLVIFFS